MAQKLSAADIAGIHQTLALFAHVFDNKDEDSLPLVFTDDLVVESILGEGYTVPGIAGARQFLGRMTADTADHNTVNTVILVDPDGTVRARSRYIAVLVDGTVHNGDYFDILRNTPQGWRISYRMSVPRFPRFACAPLPESFADAWRPGADRLPEILP